MAIHRITLAYDLMHVYEVESNESYDTVVGSVLACPENYKLADLYVQGDPEYYEYELIGDEDDE